MTVVSKHININKMCRGHYLRWYYNGWHYRFFKSADEIQASNGEIYRTEIHTMLVLGLDHLTKTDMYGLRGLWSSKNVFILTDDGWKACTIEDKSYSFGEARNIGAKIEFTISVWAKKGLFTPLLDVSTVPAPEICIIPDAETCDTSDHPRWEEDATDYGTDDFNLRILPSGWRRETGTYSFIGSTGYYMTSNTSPVVTRRLYYYNGYFQRVTTSNGLGEGWAIRLVRAAVLNELNCNDGEVIESAYVDNAGNKYDGVKIGTQVWTRTNLRDTRYSDYSLIPTGLNDTDWGNDTVGAMAVYPHGSITGLSSETEVVEAYGRLYNGYSIANAKGLVSSASAWRVPLDSDYTTLSDYLIDTYGYNSDNVGNKLKSCRQVNSPI